MNEQDYILFENYLTEKLSDKDSKTFEQRLLDDSEFDKSFKTYKELLSFLKHNIGNEEETKTFEKNLKTISNNYFEKENPSKKVMKYKPWQLAIAASFVIFISTFTYNMFSTPSYSDFSDYETISLTVRGAQDELLSNTEKAFNNQNFEQAEIYFELLLKSNPKNQEIQLYKAISEIELNKFDKAEELLVKISKGNSAYKYSSLWYLALSKLKQKDFKATKEILKTIPKDTDKYEKVQKLMKKL